MGGLRCRTCRRYVLRRSHMILLILLGVALIVGVLDLVSRLPP